MKKFINGIVFKFGGSIAALALIVTATTSNSACIWLSYQDEMPENAKKLRKF
ncbi:hypothetical protein FACS1894132_02680 [Clostridia bacterium]|nr:hypothetical protein FACS1894132_02680 [Clostridia bacterium]